MADYRRKGGSGGESCQGGIEKAADTCIFCSRILHDDGGFGGVVAMYQLFFCGGMLSFKVQRAYPLSQK